MSKKIYLPFTLIVLGMLTLSLVHAQSVSDLVTVLRSYITGANDKTGDGTTNTYDFAYVINQIYKPTPTPLANNNPTATPTSVPVTPAGTTWYQDYGNAQRTSYVSTDPKTPFSYSWVWNGGTISNHKYNAPREARVIIGNGKMYAPAGGQGVYGVNLSDGSQAWNARPGGNFNASPAYDPATNSVIAGSTNGNVYKINASSGAISGTYTAGSSVEDAILIVGNYAYAVTQSGQLHKINISSMGNVWTYSGGSRGMTAPAYSALKDYVVFGTLDLRIHAINNSNGIAVWAKNSSGNTYGNNTTYEFSTPVISDKYGLVLINMQLNYYKMTDCQGSGQFPGSTAQIQTSMTNDCQFLLAVNLTDGNQAYKTAVGYSSAEDYGPNRSGNETTVNYSTNGYGTQLNTNPVIRTLSNGDQVAYVVARSGQNLACDFRNTGVLGEMTLSGSGAGQFKFVRMARTGDNSWCGKSNVSCSGCVGISYLHIVDESATLSMAGTLIFANHWSAAVGAKLTGAGSGNSFTDPLMTQDYVFVGRAAKSGCSNHVLSGDYAYVTDGGRYTSLGSLPGGKYTNYCGEVDPPGFWVGANNQAGTSYSTGSQARFTMIGEGYMLFQGNGGDILALKYN